MEKIVRVNILGVVNLPFIELNAFQEDIKVLSPENYERMKAEILADGFSFSPHVFLDSDGKAWLLDGHQRKNCLEQMAAEGYEIPTIPCMEVQADSLEHARALVLAAASQYGTFDAKKLYEFTKKTSLEPIKLLERFVLPTIKLEKFVDVRSHLRMQGAGEIEVEPSEVETRVKWGEIWKLGEHRLMCGNSLDAENVHALFFEEGVITPELCFTSPPYADQRDYEGELELDPKKLAEFITQTKDVVKYFAVNLGISRKNGEVFPYWDDYISAAKNAGLKLLSWNIWNRGNPQTMAQQTAMFPLCHEWIFVFGKELKELNNTVENKNPFGTGGGQVVQRDGSKVKRKQPLSGVYRKLGTVLSLSGSNAEPSVKHPAKFPAALPTEYILAMTKERDWIYDPFGGSGTTLIAASQANRRCLMMEINPAYCDVILARCEKFSGEKAKLFTN